MSQQVSENTVGVVENVRPILISGVYRSGTTFLTAVINNFPTISAASSTVKYLRFCLPHHDLSKPNALDKLLTETAARISTRWSLSLDLEQIKASLQDTPINHATVYHAIMNSLLVNQKKGANRWAEKIAMQWRDIPTFLSMYPDGQVVHIFRDPRDVSASYKKMTYEPWPAFLDAALNCNAAMIELPRLQKQFGDDKILILRAEDLAWNMAGEMRRICRFLGETFDDNLTDIENFSNIMGEDWRTNSSFNEQGRNYAEAATRWKTALTPEEIFFVELFCQPEMAQFNYEGSNQPLLGLDKSKIADILSDDWLASRIQSYLASGLPEQGYRSDPYETEMNIVFGKSGK